MKKIPALILTILILCLGQHCKKSNDASNNNNNNNNNSNNSTLQPTPVGTPTGIKTSKFISTGGGSLTSADGKLELDIPDGALASDDTITVQPITNNCPGGSGSAYRLGPEGLKFNQPVTLKFHYDDSTLKSTLAGFMLIAFQDSAGIWVVLNNVNNDSVNHILSGNILHFSDWTQAEEVSITPVSATLKPGDDITLSIINNGVVDRGATVTDDNKYQYALLKGNPTTWAVNGVANGNDQFGKITVNPQVSPLYDNVKYTAPGKVPPANQNPVLVSAEFKQQFIYESNGTWAPANKVILYAHILIVDGGYHVVLKFQVEDNEYCSWFGWKDQGSFDVVFAGSSISVKNIQNSSAAIGLDSTAEGCTCSTILQKTTIGPINIVDSSEAVVNPATNMVDIIFNALDQKNYIDWPVWHWDCGPGNNGDLGGGQGPPFPGYIEFAKSDQTQTISIPGNYTMTVTPLK